MNFARFMKSNKVEREHVKYAPTKSLLDENGKPLEWELKPLTANEAEDIREACTIDVAIKGKPGMYRSKLLTKQYMAKMIVKSVVVPDLYNAELQDSYGVITPEALLMEMVDNPKEYTDFVNFVQNLNGFETLSEKVEKAKN